MERLWIPEDFVEAQGWLWNHLPLGFLAFKQCILWCLLTLYFIITLDLLERFLKCAKSS